MNDSVWYTHKDHEWSGLALTYLIVTCLDHLNSLDLGKSWFSVLCIPWWISIRWGEAYTPNLDSWIPIKILQLMENHWKQLITKWWCYVMKMKWWYLWRWNFTHISTMSPKIQPPTSLCISKPPCGSIFYSCMRLPMVNYCHKSQ